MIQSVKIGKKQTNQGAMNFSNLLDAPAGKHGFIRAEKGHLYFEDGVRGKFIGFNMPTRASMPDHETAEILSARLASMGVNVIRLHAIDALIDEDGWSCRPGYSIIDYDKGNSRMLNSAGLERLDYWFYQLKNRGIYLHLDLLVARVFQDGDGLDYPGGSVWLKFVSHVNRRLIELQKEYAKQLLEHVNQYTGLAYKDDSAIMTIQIANEDSAFFTFKEITPENSRYPYVDEIKHRFNYFLKAKYGSEEQLKAAWTFEDQSGLSENENLELGSVKIPHIGILTQAFCEPMQKWEGIQCPARYADFTEFLADINRSYYREMIDFLRGIGVKVPINTSNMSVGAADIESSMDADVMENNAYFNHPCSGPDQKHYTYAAHMREYVSTDPRKASFPEMEPRSNILTQIMPTKIEGKPFVMTEWNEYGEYPFHAAAYISTAVYACFQDLDGLIIYTYHTTDDINKDNEDEIKDVMDTFNDPSLILTFGTMASIFQKGLAKKAEHKIDVVYTRNDLTVFPRTHRMPFSYLPFVTGTQCVYLNHTEQYEGNADAAIDAGFTSSYDLSGAKHGILYAHTPYRNAYRKDYMGERLFDQHTDTNEILSAPNVTLGDKFLKTKTMSSIQNDLDFTGFANYADEALKRWGILKKNQGIDEKNALISDTGEIRFSPDESCFSFIGENCAFFAGKPSEVLMKSNTKIQEIKSSGCRLTEQFSFAVKNDRIAISLLTLDGKNLKESGHLLISAIGRSGMDGAVYEKMPDSPEYSETDVTRISKEGKLYLETLEGTLYVEGEGIVSMYALDVYGSRIRKYEVKSEGTRKIIVLDGDSYGNFELIIAKE